MLMNDYTVVFYFSLLLSERLDLVAIHPWESKGGGAYFAVMNGGVWMLFHTPGETRDILFIHIHSHCPVYKVRCYCRQLTNK